MSSGYEVVQSDIRDAAADLQAVADGVDRADPSPAVADVVAAMPGSASSPTCRSPPTSCRRTGSRTSPRSPARWATPPARATRPAPPGRAPGPPPPRTTCSTTCASGSSCAASTGRSPGAFPEAYDRDGARQARLGADGVDYEITVGAEPGTTQQQAGERLVEQGDGLGAEVEEVEDVEVAGRSFTRAGFSTPGRSLLGWFVTPRGSTSTVAVLLSASTSLEDVPPERLGELDQLLASLELGPRQGPGS